ncbi:hypothetical protein ACJX0J_024241, partial [Zea mays]
LGTQVRTREFEVRKIEGIGPNLDIVEVEENSRSSIEHRRVTKLHELKIYDPTEQIKAKNYDPTEQIKTNNYDPTEHNQGLKWITWKDCLIFAFPMGMLCVYIQLDRALRTEKAGLEAEKH